MEAIELIASWIDAQAESVKDCAARRLSDRQKGEIAADLEGMEEAGQEITQLILRTAENLVSNKLVPLEDLAIDLEIHVEHVIWHWKSLKKALEKAGIVFP